jgi:hypothetical protein
MADRIDLRSRFPGDGVVISSGVENPPHRRGARVEPPVAAIRILTSASSRCETIRREPS